MGIGYLTAGLGCGGSDSDARCFILKILVCTLKKPNTSAGSLPLSIAVPRHMKLI